MADVTFTIAILDDGTPVLREIKKEAQSMGETVATAGKQAAAGLSAVAKEEGTLAAVTRTATKAAQDELQLLTQKIAIQQKVRDGALTVAQSTRQMAEAEIYAKTGSRELSQALAAARGEFERNERAIHEQTKGLHQLDQNAARASAGLRTLVTSLISLTAIQRTITIAEDMQGLRASLEALPSVGNQAALVFEGIRESANSAGVSLRTANDVFQRLGFGLQSIGASNQELLIVVDTLNKLGAVGRVSAQNMESALTQLGQIFSQGKFQADELNVILAQAPPIIAGIARGLGVSTDALLRLRAEGKLTIEDTFRGLLNIAEATTAQFDKLPPTVSRSVQTAANELGVVIDRLNEKFGITEAIAVRIRNTTQFFAQTFGVETQTAQIQRLREELERFEAIESALRSERSSGGLLDRLLFDPKRAAELKVVGDEIARLKGALAGVEAASKGAGDGIKGAVPPRVTEEVKNFREELDKQILSLTTQAQQAKLSERAFIEWRAAQLVASGATEEQVKQFQALSLTILAAKEAREADRKATQEHAKAASEARAQIAIYEQVAAGILTSAEAQRQLEAAQLATRVGSAALAQQLLDTKQAAEDKAKTDELIVRLSAEHDEVLTEEEKAFKALAAQTTRTAEQNRDLAATIEDGIKAGRTYDSILRDVAIRQKEMELTGKVAADQVHKLAVASVDAAAELDKQEAALQKLNGAPIDFGDRIIDNFSQVLAGIRQGTRDIGDLLDGLQDTFVTTFIEMFAKTLKEKVNWEIALSDNLLNDLPALFTQSGAQSGQGFLSSLFSWLGNTGGQTQGLGAGFGVIFGSESIDAAGVEWTSGWPDIFDGLGGTAQTGGKSFGSAFGIAAIASIAATVGQDFARGQYGAGAGGIVGGVIGAYFGGPEGALLGGQIGRLLGGLLDPLFAPGRIQKEKQRLEDYFDEVFGGGFDIVKEKQAALGLATFEASRAAALALGATDARRTTGSNAGTVVRFGGQLEGNFEEQGKSAEEAKKAVLRLAQAMGVDLATSIDDINELVKTNVFSLSEFAEEVEESRKNLKKYGDTSGLTVKQLNELALANGNTGSFVVTLNELYAGAIDLATGFSKSIDGLAIANKLLSQTFLEAAGGADALNGNVGVLAGQIKDGTLSIEEAVTQLNAMRAAAGQTQLSLDQITLHPEEIAKEVAIIQTALEEGAQAAQGLGSLLGNAIMNGLAPLGEDVKNFFRALFGNQILGGIIQTAITTLNIQGILAPIFEEIIRAQEALASKTITEEEYKARLKGILADAGPEIEKIKAGLLAAGEAGRALLDELGLLPDTLDDATDSADALVARIRDLQAEIRELANERIEIHLQVLDDLASIGFLPALDAIDARIASIQDRIAGFGIGPIATSPFGHLSDADLKTLIDLQDQLRQATLARYQEEARLIQERAQAAISQIQEEYAARRQAIQETINGLQAQRSATQKLYQEQLQKLQEQLAVAQEFGRVADSLTQIIRNATQSAESPLDRNQQFTLLQREADVIRRSLLSSTGRERAEQIGDLAQILQSQLSFVDRNSAGGQQLFNRLLTELASLRGDAQKEGDNAAKIQEEIKNTTARMDAALASIDKQIAAQQALLASLSAQEQAEIRKVQETAQAELRALQERTAREIQEQAERRDLALQEQIRRLEAQEATAREQLEKLIGAEAAQKLLAAGDEAHTLQLAQANLTLFAIDARIKELVDKIQPAATGYHNTGSGNHLFLTHPNERIDITPAGQRAPVSSGGGASVAISFAPVVHVTVAPGEEGRVKQDVGEVLRMAEIRVKRLIQTDWVPEIRRAAEGRL